MWELSERRDGMWRAATGTLLRRMLSSGAHASSVNLRSGLD